MNESYKVTLKLPWTSGCDGVGYDFDNSTTDGLGEYLYSHNNFNTGLFLFANSPRFQWNRNGYRYSISENDAQGGFTGFGMLGIQPFGGNPSLFFYNNTAYNNKTYTGVRHQNPGQGAAGLSISAGAPFSGFVANNIYVTSKSVHGIPIFINNANTGFNPTVVLRNNAYFSLNGGASTFIWANVLYSGLPAFQTATGQDTNSINVNPNFSGSPSFGACSWTPRSNNGPQPCPGAAGAPAYGLSAGSPMKSAGFDLTGTYNIENRDYYGNTFPGSGNCYNMGAYGVCPRRRKRSLPVHRTMAARAARRRHPRHHLRAAT
jgi:hypothetical protein